MNEMPHDFYCTTCGEMHSCENPYCKYEEEHEGECEGWPLDHPNDYLPDLVPQNIEGESND